MKAKRIVGFLDVLGFSALVSREDFGERFANYIELIRRIIKSVDETIEHTVFSDSIVILSKNSSEQDLNNVVRVVSRLTYEFMVSLTLPIKGCIAEGNISSSTSGKDSVIAGPPIVEAYRYEQAQNWVGVMISPNVLRTFRGVVQKSEVKGHRTVPEDMIGKRQIIAPKIVAACSVFWSLFTGDQHGDFANDS